MFLKRRRGKNLGPRPGEVFVRRNGSWGGGEEAGTGCSGTSALGGDGGRQHWGEQESH